MWGYWSRAREDRVKRGCLRQHRWEAGLRLLAFREIRATVRDWASPGPGRAPPETGWVRISGVEPAVYALPSPGPRSERARGFQSHGSRVERPRRRTVSQGQKNWRN